MLKYLRRILLAVQAEAAKSLNAILLCLHKTVQTILLHLTTDKKLVGVTLKGHCHPRISYGHTKLIAEVHTKNIYTRVRARFYH